MPGRDGQQGAVTEQQVIGALSNVIEPELHRDLVTLDMIKDLAVDGGTVRFSVVLTTPACPLRTQIEQEVRAAVMALPGVDEVAINMTANVAADPRVRGHLEIPVRNTIAIASGKGGVGKSTLSVNLAIALSHLGAEVGLLDADIYGPNIPMMLGLRGMPPPREDKMVPAEGYGLKVVSMGFLVPPDQPVVWRGPMLHSALRQFLIDVDWGPLDYLVVDMPPGTGDVQLSLAQSVPLTGGVIITTPQDVALADARKGRGYVYQVGRAGAGHRREHELLPLSALWRAHRCLFPRWGARGGRRFGRALPRRSRPRRCGASGWRPGPAGRRRQPRLGPGAGHHACGPGHRRARQHHQHGAGTGRPDQDQRDPGQLKEALEFG